MLELQTLLIQIIISLKNYDVLQNIDLIEQLFLSHENWIVYILILNQPNLMESNFATQLKSPNQIMALINQEEIPGNRDVFSSICKAVPDPSVSEVTLQRRGVEGSNMAIFLGWHLTFSQNNFYVIAFSLLLQVFLEITHGTTYGSPDNIILCFFKTLLLEAKSPFIERRYIA